MSSPMEKDKDPYW